MASSESAKKTRETLDRELEKRKKDRDAEYEQRKNNRGEMFRTDAGEQWKAFEKRRVDSMGKLLDGQDARQKRSEEFRRFVTEDIDRRRFRPDAGVGSAERDRVQTMKMELEKKVFDARLKQFKFRGQDSQPSTPSEFDLPRFEVSSAGSSGTFNAGVASSIAGGGV